MLQPKRVKYRKVHRGRLKGGAHSGNTIAFGDFGLRAEESAWVTARQIEAARRVFVRYLRRGGRLWIRIFPDKAVTKKPAETRMGSGKGAPDHWVAVVKRGRIMFELVGIKEDVAREAVHLASHKLPIATSFATKEGQDLPCHSEPFAPPVILSEAKNLTAQNRLREESRDPSPSLRSGVRVTTK